MIEYGITKITIIVPNKERFLEMENEIKLSVTEFQQVISETVASTIKAVKSELFAKSEEEESSGHFYTRPEVMKLLRITTKAFTALTTVEGFPGRLVGKSWLIPKDEFNKWIVDNKMGMF